MKPNSVILAAAGLALVSVTPAFAASLQVEAACFAQAEQVRPVLTQPEKEAFIAGCIADATPGPGAQPGNKY